MNLKRHISNMNHVFITQIVNKICITRIIFNFFNFILRNIKSVSIPQSTTKEKFYVGEI